MTKIGIIGATGNAGSSIFKESCERGHELTAVVRDQGKAEEMFGKNINIIEKDAFELLRSDLENFDVVVNAFGTSPTQAKFHVDLAQNLVSLFREAENSPRLFFILGAGSLLDENGELFVETIRQAPNSEEFIAVPEQQIEELDYLRKVESVDWVGVSPGAEFKEGEAADFKIGRDHILKNNEGDSYTTSGTLAKAILDEIENPQFKNERFTVINT